MVKRSRKRKGEIYVDRHRVVTLYNLLEVFSLDESRLLGRVGVSLLRPPRVIRLSLVFCSDGDFGSERVWDCQQMDFSDVNFMK